MLSVVTPSTVEPVSVAELKIHARIDHDEEDELLAAYITSARQWCESYVHRYLTATGNAVRLDLDGFCDRRYVHSGVIYLPNPPLASSTTVAISYLPSNGSTATTWDSTYYTVDARSETARIALVYGATFPDALPQMASVTITYTAGYSTSNQVPAGCKTAIKMLAAHLYENREPILTGTIVADVPFGLQALLDAHKWGGYI